jgi:squalene synthase HpnC
VTLTSFSPLHENLNRAAIEIMTRDQPGMLAAEPAADMRTKAGNWDAAAAARVASQVSAENFPVALRLLPRRYRRHLLAVYAYARTVDDVGDLAPPAERPRLLGALRADVARLYAAAGSGTAEPESPVVRGLAPTVTDCGIPMQLLLDLISANEQDQIVSRYATFDDLLGYCRLSANPIGRIVLHIFGCFTDDRARQSDAICAGLQLAEHWQDVAEDLQAGRIYLPADDLARFGCTEQDLGSGPAPARVRRLLAFETGRAAELIDAGAPLIRGLPLVPRAAIAGYVAGGRAALAAIARADYDVLAFTPRPGKVRTAAELVLAFARAR